MGRRADILVRSRLERFAGYGRFGSQGSYWALLRTRMSARRSELTHRIPEGWPPIAQRFGLKNAPLVAKLCRILVKLHGFTCAYLQNRVFLPALVAASLRVSICRAASRKILR